LGVVLEVALTRVSSKGQVVIPAEIKRSLGIKSGDKLLVIAAGDAILMVRVPKAGFLELVRPVWERVRELGLTGEDIDVLIEEAKAEGRPR
jgi:AbrB family looped-hinge helix DNA binding protein